MPNRHITRPQSSGDAGFTILELLVTIVVLSILAAIAIPVLAGHKQKASVAQLKSDLRNAATAEAVYHASAGSYTANEAELKAVGGWRTSPGVAMMSQTSAAPDAWCIELTHEALPAEHPWKIAHASHGRPVTRGPCPSASLLTAPAATEQDHHEGGGATGAPSAEDDDDNDSDDDSDDDDSDGDDDDSDDDSDD